MATVRASAGQLIFKTLDWGMSLESISGRDINGDGEPDLVFVGYSGGAHCCWTYWIVSLGGRPGLIKKIENERTAEFKPTGPNGRIEVWTFDGAFDYFDDFSHAETVFPDVVLRIEGHSVRDVSADHRDFFDHAISNTRARLTPEVVQKSKSFAVHSSEIRSYEGDVLKIVFAYLYGGRPREAWRALDDYWPEHDVQHIKQVILHDRAYGVLRYVTLRPSG
ncbi:MAG: hypothetical protein WB949_06640 [Candidatus Acidiferrales bacterium]